MCTIYPSPFQEEPKDTSKILSDLGRATKRGIKKCFKCGTYNGTRCLICKNKHCDAVFKECGEKQKTNLDAIKLISGTSRQVFSVRVRDKGPDCRGFVQLPLIQGSNEAKEKNVALSEVALCFVDSCQRLFDDSILKCHEMEQNKVNSICIHIKSALKSVNEAVPIETKSCLLNSLHFDEDIKHKLWLLATKTEGAVVQRVSKTVMAVKCQVSPKHPLGYLHFTFCVAKGKATYDKFYCSCLNFKGYSCLNDNLTVLNQKCIHFYACVWAFASDLKFAEEFIDFLNIELYIDNSFPMRVIGDGSLNISDDFVASNSQKSKYCYRKTNQQKPLYSTSKKLHIYPANSKLKLKQKKFVKKGIVPVSKKQKINNCTKMQISLKFIDWLTSVTERINQTLGCRQNERVECLSFYIPSAFFELLADRLQNSGKKSNQSYVISGTTGTSYLIFSIPYVKEIFDTPQVSLSVMKLFIQNEPEICTKVPCQQKQKSAEYKQLITFLKIGMMKSDNNSIPFTVNWTPNVLPTSKFGKLEIVFHVGSCDSEEFNERFL